MSRRPSQKRPSAPRSSTSRPPHRSAGRASSQKPRSRASRGQKTHTQATRRKKTQKSNQRFSMFFWQFKILKLFLTAAGMAFFLLWPGLQEKGVFAAAIIGAFGLAFTFQDGFSKRQWRRREYGGLNEALVWFGRIAMGIAALVTLYWFSTYMIENFESKSDKSSVGCIGFICLNIDAENKK